MSSKQPVVIKPRVRLKDFDPEYCGDMDKEHTKAKTQQLGERIGQLQELLYANASHSVVIMFQGMDAAGKDGAVKRVLEFVNPAGVETVNFKVPSDEERAHDFLWRHHKAIPRYGWIGVHNRSHYESVLVERVMDLVPRKVWKRRYTQINEFEHLLAENNVIFLKFFLYVSKEEQARRLRDRLKDPSKNWKFEKGDLKTRKRWDDYMEAYEDALNECSPNHCRWHLLPGDNKWYRDYLAATIVVEALESLKMDWPKPKEDLSKIRIV
ncbi:MAG TPA: PPK2 family polyphosphate kinase [Verrucomicrobiae bacterium]|nr:PPK2 family polyphosphate kinase [Verrucomicrobiae bacterium]